jgi:hypothetical protein
VGPSESTIRLALRIAERTDTELMELLAAAGDDITTAGPLLSALVRHAVLRAFGCTCSTLFDDKVLDFDEIVCPIHGIGPVEDPGPPGANPEPGS